MLLSAKAQAIRDDGEREALFIDVLKASRENRGPVSLVGRFRTGGLRDPSRLQSRSLQSVRTARVDGEVRE